MRNHRSLSSTVYRVLDFSLPVLIAGVWLIGTATRAAEPPGGLPSSSVLHLTNGGFVPGELKDSDQPGNLRWQSTSFVSPFDFAMNAVNAIHFPLPAEVPKPSGTYCFELAGDDVLFGSLIDLVDEDAELDVPPFGRLHVRRANIHRIYRWRDSSDLIYLGPNGLTGWHQPTPEKGWREELGQLVTEHEGASLHGDPGIPARAAIEFEVSWKNTPDFVLALGVGDDEKSIQRSFRFEVWGGDLVVQRETEQEADVSSVGAIAAGPGRAHLQAYLDQDQGRILVFSTNGKQLADLRVAGPKRQVLSGVQLINKRGDVRLELLRIGRWNGEPPTEAPADKSRIHRADGSIVYGQVTKFDAASKEFVVREETGESRIAEDVIASVFLSSTTDDQPRAIRAVNQDGSRLSGNLIKVEAGALWLTLPGVKETLQLPVAGLRSLALLRLETPPSAKVELSGILELDGVRLPGRLVDGREQTDSSCLAWQPQGSATASPLRPKVSGRIVYREPPPSRPAPRAQAAPAPPAGAVVRILRGGTTDQPSQPQPSGRRSLYLHLRTGDSIPCEVTKIDENGVSFRTPLSDSTFVAHDKVKAVELAPENPNQNSIKLNKTKRERLLTLPRMQKESPPTQLIRSKNGDYLRGRVVQMDAKTLQVEVRLETKDVPRDRISRIIWLHPDELDASKGPAKSSEGRGPTRVQALRNDGIRMTFFAEQFEDGTLSGKSDVLGACRVRLKEVDQLLIGGAIEKAAAQLTYQQWKLQNAAEPKVSQGDDGQSPAGRTAGTDSPLVGKPAPDFTLELLGGKKFHLADSKGKVVVLDFWATWCGPCMQAMPQVDRVTHEFQDRGVQLIAVNLQETPKQISDMLERHKLGMTVVLDRDGVVADKFAATAIPQTVIIDRDGKIARLFVGGGPHFDDQLREALDAVVSGGSPKEPTK